MPYTLDSNDMRFATPQGFPSGDQFFAYLKDSFDTLWAEGATAPKMLSIGLHCRLVGRPGRAASLTVEKIKRFWMPWPNAKQFDGLFAKIAIAAYFIPVLLAAGLGWLTGPRNFWSWLLTLGPLFYFCALHAIFLGSLRYRLPTEYPLCIAAAIGLQQGWHFLCRGRPKEAGSFPAPPAGA